MKTPKTVLIILAALLAAAIAGGAVAALASDNGPVATTAATTDQAEDEIDDTPSGDTAEGPDRPITGPDLEKASAAALDHLGEGRVTETEIEDEESHYEVEVTLPDGRQIDVQLDEAFNVVGTD